MESDKTVSVGITQTKEGYAIRYANQYFGAYPDLETAKLVRESISKRLKGFSHSKNHAVLVGTRLKIKNNSLRHFERHMLNLYLKKYNVDTLVLFDNVFDTSLPLNESRIELLWKFLNLENDQTTFRIILFLNDFENKIDELTHLKLESMFKGLKIVDGNKPLNIDDIWYSKDATKIASDRLNVLLCNDTEATGYIKARKGYPTLKVSGILRCGMFILSKVFRHNADIINVKVTY